MDGLQSDKRPFTKDHVELIDLPVISSPASDLGSLLNYGDEEVGRDAVPLFVAEEEQDLCGPLGVVMIVKSLLQLG